MAVYSLYKDIICVLLFQTDKMVYLATECVEPLYNRLTQKCNSENESKKELYFSWGIFQITVRINEIYVTSEISKRHAKERSVIHVGRFDGRGHLIS